MAAKPKPPKLARPCKARSARTGKPCRLPAILGGTVCIVHGGRAPQVQRKAAERLADLIDPDRALREAARLAYSDIRTLLGPDGHLLPPQQWSDAAAAAVQSIKVTRKAPREGDTDTEFVTELRLWDKNSPLGLIFRHLGLIVERSERGKPGDFAALSNAEKVAKLEALLEKVKTKMGGV